MVYAESTDGRLQMAFPMDSWTGLQGPRRGFEGKPGVDSRGADHMKRTILAIILALTCSFALVGCSDSSADSSTDESAATETEETETAEEESEDSESEDSESTDESDAEEESSETSGTTDLEDGEYTVDFDTDSSMFHINEALDGKGTLTVEDGEMTVHITLVSQKIVNLYVGTAEEAQEDGAVWLEPTLDEVTYDDGYTEEVYGFDVPVPAIDEDFNVAILGEKGTWYDHVVSVSNPEPVE